MTLPKKQLINSNLKPKPVLNADTPLRYLKGVGPQLAAVFQKKNIQTLKHLINWYPRTYQSQKAVHDFSLLSNGAQVTLYGYIAQKKVITTSSKRRIYEIIIQTPSEWIACKYFRLPYRSYFDGLKINQKVKVSGRVGFYHNQPELHHPDIFPLHKEEEHTDQLIPIYTELEKISQHKIKKIIDSTLTVLEQDSNFVEDPLPLSIRKENQLIDKLSALKQIHQPIVKYAQDYLSFQSPAQKRLIFEEFFLLQLYLGLKKAGFKKQHIQPMNQHSTLINQIKKSLPFELTSAQKKVLNEICQDLSKNTPMYRLIQGDVGCGKTIVALLACCQVIENGFQCAIMTPTEILSEQHYQNMSTLLKPYNVEIVLLTGKTKTREKKTILEKLKTGVANLCIGTHALIQESVQFHKMGLVIIDEQHRFGVHQRGRLKEKGYQPHFLVMTATPIPRSLAMTVYGDLDVSVIDEMPPGRKTIITKKTTHSNRYKVLDFLKNEIQTGRQAYIVYPLVKESEHIDLKNAIEEYEQLKKIFPDFQIGLLHGQMNATEKQTIMSQFVEGTTQILVSTTIIEVGVDVANASVMIVENAERFGLSQLHQLRGRIGRGSYKSYCILILSKKASKEALQRVSIMETTQDGFKIAEADLELRGPGEFLGIKQSGISEFKIANLIRDIKILQQAKKSAFQMIQQDPFLAHPNLKLLKKEIQKLNTQLLPG